MCSSVTNKLGSNLVKVNGGYRKSIEPLLLLCIREKTLNYPEIPSVVGEPFTTPNKRNRRFLA